MSKSMFAPHVETMIAEARRQKAAALEALRQRLAAAPPPIPVSRKEFSERRAIDAVAALFPQSSFAARLRRGARTSLAPSPSPVPVPEKIQRQGSTAPACPPAHTQLRHLQPMDRFEGSYVIRNPQRRTRCDGAQYWKLVLGDDTGWLVCYLWPESQLCFMEFLHGEEIFVEARARLYAGYLVADIQSVNQGKAED